MRASRQSEDSLEFDEDVCNSYPYYDDEDVSADSFEYDGAYHNMNIGSVEKRWSVYLESAPEDDCAPAHFRTSYHLWKWVTRSLSMHT